MYTQFKESYTKTVLFFKPSDETRGDLRCFKSLSKNYIMSRSVKTPKRQTSKILYVFTSTSFEIYPDKVPRNNDKAYHVYVIM